MIDNGRTSTNFWMNQHFLTSFIWFGKHLKYDRSYDKKVGGQVTAGMCTCTKYLLFITLNLRPEFGSYDSSFGGVYKKKKNGNHLLARVEYVRKYVVVYTKAVNAKIEMNILNPAY